MTLPSGVGGRAARWLFSEHFLSDRLPEWADFADLDVGPLHAALSALVAEERHGLPNLNEGATEDRFIRPVLTLLGHAYSLFPEIPPTGRKPDYFLYSSVERRNEAEAADSGRKMELAAAVADAKRFDLSLDRRSPEGDPVAQIISYVRLANRPYGVLTNGRVWRLYARQSGLVEKACYEVDLFALLDGGEPADLRYFAAFFGAPAFVAAEDGRTFLDRALDDSSLHSVEVSEALETAVFAAVPAIATGLLAEDDRTPEALQIAFANSLVFLYRVLFTLFAEARHLLPVGNEAYRRYSVSKQRGEIARLIEEGRPLSATSDALFAELRGLFRMIDKGDPALGVTEYDGGLFDPQQHLWLEGRSVPDSLLARSLDGLYRVEREFVDYRNLSVRLLGSVYEKLLAWELADVGGVLVLRESPRRHETGSFFTPEPIVDAIVARTLDPIVSRRSQEVRAAGLSGQEALDALLRIRVLDPAMGSGHFLVGAADYLALAIATDPSYDGELPLDEVRRLVAERCLYGVDLNELAVELARLSLWLATARAGEPLTFLANLRAGDSLVGADSETLFDPMTGLLEAHVSQTVGQLLGEVAAIEAMVTRTAADARTKRRSADRADVLRDAVAVFASQAIERYLPPPGRPQFHWPLAFPEVFVAADGRPLDGAGFDAVIGNPPYIRVQEIGRPMAEYCRRRFATASGSFDAYIAFLERGIDLLNPNGRLGYIVPNKLFKLEFGEGLRGRLSAEMLVEEVLDFGDTQLFAGATNYTCILVLDRASQSELSYRRFGGSASDVLNELAAPDHLSAEVFSADALGRTPWILVPPSEAAVIRLAQQGSRSLESATQHIFQGLITSADDVFVLEDRGTRGGRRVVWSRADAEEIELESDLLHPLASGGDIAPYTFRPLRSLLLFPYVQDAGQVRLLSEDELSRWPLTHAYLKRHEAKLRGRERGRMDQDSGWWAFGRTQNMSSHVLPKLAVPRLCDRLRVAIDMDGSAYLDNVDVNGILVRDEGLSALYLATILNSKLLDWIFRRHSVPFQNGFFSANRQFIAGLPIQYAEAPVEAELEALGREMQRISHDFEIEREGFRQWLAGTLGCGRSKLPRFVDGYDALTDDEFFAALTRSATRGRYVIDVRARASRELISRELSRSVQTLAPLRRNLESARAVADAAVFDLYELPLAMRVMVDFEY